MQQQVTNSTDRVGFAFAAVFLGGVASSLFGRPGHTEDLAVIVGIAIVVMGVVAVSFEGEQRVPPWNKAAAERRRFKSYVGGLLACVPFLVWIGLAVNLNNEWGAAVYFAPLVLIVLGLGYLYIIHPRILRRRLMREEFKNDL